MLMDQRQLLVEFLAVNLEQGQEQRSDHGADEEAHDAEESDAPKDREKYQQVVHAGAVADDDRFEEVVDQAYDKSGDEKNGDALPDLTAQKQDEGGGIHSKPGTNNRQDGK